MAARTSVMTFLAFGCIIINLVQAKDDGQGFMLTGPRRLLAGTTETFCVSVKDITHSLANCTLDLIVDKSIITSVNHRLNGIKECFKVPVPMIENTNAELRWRMHFYDLPDYKVDAKKEIAVTQIEMEPLIQTDKAWYTPGQLVRFRILSLNHMLHPILDPISRIWVEDPTGSVIIQWTNVTTIHGIIQQELQLSQEPVQGVWKIKMEREPNQRKGTGQQEFEVREYILPRFEVIFNPTPASITYNQEGDKSVQKIPIGICAKYSYGQPVKGTWKANIKVENKGKYYRFDSTKKDTRSVNIDKSGVLNDLNGCHTLKLSGNDLEITTNDGTIDKTISITATVIEQGTDLEANATWSTNVKTQKLVMDISSWSSNTFKNGLPYYGTMKMRLEGADEQSSLNGTSVEICIQISNYNRPKRSSVDRQRPQTMASGRIPDRVFKPESMRFGRQRNPTVRGNRRGDNKGQHQSCSQYVSDSQGLVHFQFTPTDSDAIEYQVKATVSKSRGKRQILIDSLGSETSPHQTEFTVQSSYSPTNSYLSFVPPSNYPDAVPCNSKLPIKLYFTADNKTDKFNLHYMVMSRGDVLHSDVLQVTYRKVDKVHLTNSLPPIAGAANVNLNVGSVEFDLEIKPEFSPKVSILAYYIRDDKEVVTAAFDLQVEKCFPNPVKFSWASKKKQPGQNVSFQLKSGPGSICGYSVVDRSVTFIRPDLQLSEAKVLSPLSNFHIDRHSWPHQVTPDWKYCADKVHDEEEKIRDQHERPERSIAPWMYDRSTSQVKDAMEAIQNSGLLVISDMNIETRPCIKRYVDWAPRMMASPSMSSNVFLGRSASSAEDLGERSRVMRVNVAESVAFHRKEIHDENSYENVVDLTSTVAVRTYFPETWLWDLVNLDFKGELKKTVELPHTISNWVGRALCVSETDGFGMSSPAEIEAFQPFFLELHLPYSVKRTEKLKLKVSVFNYAKQALPVRLTLDRSVSETIQIVGNGTSDYSAQLCVPPQTNLVHHFLVYATELGRHNITVTAAIDDMYPGECGSSSQQAASDTVIKELLVQPEGFPVERLYSQMVCPKDFDEEDKTIVWDLSLPSDLVQGSARAWITAVGDLMGPALQGLTGLVRLPMGCGEQNMVLFTPIIYVVRYLSATNQLDNSIKKKSLDFMTTGYQRELTYRHDDGSYSAFGKSDREGSLWLTAFVIKSFAAARRYIHIDTNDLKTSIDWLIPQQQSNGCFPAVGTVLHQDLKGGLSGNKNDLTPLTAFTLIALLEARETINQQDPIDQRFIIAGHKVLDKALSCLSIGSDAAITVADDPYTTALTAYALVLANRTEEARKKIDWMMNHAQRNNSLIWWHKTGSGPALRVEMTSYVLLSLVKLGSKQDLMDARSIVRWLSKQRNSEGGFISTQDTVVGLQAIAAYAESIGTQPIDMKVTVNAGEFDAVFDITEGNRLVQRRIDLPSPLALNVEIDSVGEGEGCAILQSTLRYNVHRPPPSDAFQLNVTHYELTEGSCSRGRRIQVCARYSPSPYTSSASNMVLIELSLTSGYVADKQSLEALVREQKMTFVKRFELKDDVVILYFDEMVAKKDYCVGMDVKAAFEVNDAKDANVKIYDYYQPEHGISVSYNLPPGVDHNENGCDIP